MAVILGLLVIGTAQAADFDAPAGQSGQYISSNFSASWKIGDTDDQYKSCEITASNWNFSREGIRTRSAPDTVCSFTWSGGLLSGEVKLAAAFRHANGSWELSGTSTYTVDANGPSGGTLTVTAGNGENTLSWGGFSDTQSGLRGTNTYDVRFLTGATPPTCASGTSFYTGTETSRRHISLTNGTQYSYRVCAYDAVDNVSAGPTGSGKPDGTPPTVVGTVKPSPESGSFVPSNFTLTTQFSDADSDIRGCQFTLDNSVWYVADLSGSGATRTCTMSLTNLYGPLSLNMRATSAGGTRTATAISRTVDNYGPTGGPLAVAVGDTRNTLSWPAFTDIGYGVHASGLHATDTYKVRFATGATPPTCSSGTLLYTGTGTSYTHAGLTNGVQYSYRLCAYDKLENVSAELAATAGSGTPVDGSAPSAAAVTASPQTGAYVPPAFTLSTAFTDEGSTISSCQYTTDGAVWKAGTLSGSSPTRTCTANLSGLSGTLTLNMRATSLGGTGTATAISRIVDTAPPTGGSLTVTSGNGRNALSWGAFTDAGFGLRGVDTYEVRGATGATAPGCSGGTQVYKGSANIFLHAGLTNGTQYAYRVCAYDALNNLSNGVTGGGTPLAPVEGTKSQQSFRYDVLGRIVGTDQNRDEDGDGVFAPEDCNDKDPGFQPLPFELFGNGIDDDCNGRVDEAPDTGAHALHSGAAGYAMTCADCHNGPSTMKPDYSWSNGLSIGFDPFKLYNNPGDAGDNDKYAQRDSIYYGQQGTFYAGEYGRGPGGVNDPAAYPFGTKAQTVSPMDPDAMKCRNVYCHGQGKLPAQGFDTPSLTPPWDGTWAAGGDPQGDGDTCNNCHASPPVRDSHKVHADRGIKCFHCHNASTYQDLADGGKIKISDKSLHVNGVYDVSGGGEFIFNSYPPKNVPVVFDYTFAPGGGTCSSNQCHVIIGFELKKLNIQQRWSQLPPVLGASIAVQQPATCPKGATSGTVTATVTNSCTDCYAPFTYSVDWGDGTAPSTQAINDKTWSVSHTYADKVPNANETDPNKGVIGTYAARWSVKDVYGNKLDTPDKSDWMALPIGVCPVPNKAPVPAFTVVNTDYANAPPYEVELTDLSTDPDYNTDQHYDPAGIRPGTIRVEWGGYAYNDRSQKGVTTQSIELTTTPSNRKLKFQYYTDGYAIIKHCVKDNDATAVYVCSPSRTIFVVR